MREFDNISIRSDGERIYIGEEVRSKWKARKVVTEECIVSTIEHWLFELRSKYARKAHYWLVGDLNTNGKHIIDVYLSIDDEKKNPHGKYELMPREMPVMCRNFDHEEFQKHGFCAYMKNAEFPFVVFDGETAEDSTETLVYKQCVTEDEYLDYLAMVAEYEKEESGDNDE